MESVNIVNSVIACNDGICLYPYSNYIFFDEKGENKTVEEFHEDLVETKCMDIVMVNSHLYVEPLSWLIPKLLSERFHVACMTNIDQIVPLPFSRYIVLTDCSAYKRRVDKFRVLRENDVVVLRTKEPREVSFVRNSFMKEEIKCGLAFDSNLISHEDMIKAGIYDVGSYNGPYGVR